MSTPPRRKPHLPFIESSDPACMQAIPVYIPRVIHEKLPTFAALTHADLEVGAHGSRLFPLYKAEVRPVSSPLRPPPRILELTADLPGSPECRKSPRISGALQACQSGLQVERRFGGRFAGKILDLSLTPVLAT